MSKTQLLRMLINERLSAAAMEIFDVVERTIADYEEEVRYSKRENARQRELFNKLLKPEIRLHRADPQKYTLPKQKVPPEQQHCEQERSPSLDQEDPEPPQIKEEVPPEQHHCEQERSPSLDQEDPEPPQIKEEQDGLWTSEEGEKLKNLKEEETDTKNSMFSQMLMTDYERSCNGQMPNSRVGYVIKKRFLLEVGSEFAGVSGVSVTGR
ncbi:uncharacterized protein FYW47_014589 [Aplochiton taeniatus]